ncbi:DUF6090 family protein [Winogradskyella sediminis]|uniref:DUF6090 family protein n=1 Tax=Winogradskyella sediminis TaxID=1382466 RepID=UPI003AA89A52
MAKIFRTFRKKMIKENRFRKYFIYAIGEIVLVVIGILIALWINKINNSYQNSKKEIILLSEIRENLVADSIQINEISKFHKAKKIEIYNILQIISENKPSKENRNKLLKYFTTGTIFEIREFISKSAGYNNLIYSGNIELIKKRELKNLLTQYYLSTSKNLGAMEVAKNKTRQFKEYIIPKTISNWSLKNLTGLEFELQNQEYVVGLNNDEKTISSLIQMSMQIDFSRSVLLELQKNIKDLINEIDLKINTKNK